jgi:uncharacterized membrane protein
MDDNSKTWLQSKTIWGALIAIAASVAGLAGVGIEAGEEAEIVEGIISLVAAGGGILAIIGRIAVRSRLR